MSEQEHTRTGGQQVSGSRRLSFIRPKGQTKRFFAVISLFFLLFTVTAQIGTPTTISVEPLYTRVPAGEPYTLNITVDPEGNQVSGLQYKLYFDSTVANATTQTNGTFLSQDGITTRVLENKTNNSIGMVSYAEYRIGVDYGVTGPGIAAAIVFEAIKPGMSTLIMTDVILSDPDAISIPTTILNGWVDVVPSTPSPFIVSGYVFFENGSECLNPEVTITNQNLSRDWTAEVSASSNYYEYNLTHPFEVMDGDILRFDAQSRDRRYLKSATHTVTEEEIGNERMIFNITLQRRIIRDVKVSTAYYPGGNGIMILDAGGGIVTQLELGELYYIRYEVANEGEQDELVNVTAKISNAGWSSNIATHDWFITSGNSIVAPPPPIGDCLNTSGLSADYYNVSVKATIQEDHNPDFYPDNNERIRPVPIGVTPTPPPTPDTISIDLNLGWNLISVPLNLISWVLGEEAAVGEPLNVTPKNSLTSIYRYNTSTALFEKCDYFDDWGWWPATGSESFTELEPGRGYWVMAKNDCDLTFTGTEAYDIDVTLATDWNLIGWYSLEEALLGEEAVAGNPLDVTPTNSLTSIYRYNSSTELFEKCDHFDDWGWWPATGSGGFTELEPGRGYWVMAEHACVWRHVI